MEKLEKLHSSLPFNLDEAAEEYAPDFSNSIASKAAVDAIRDAFKEGVKWAYENPKEGLIDIDKACEWLKENTYFYVDDYTGSLNEEKLTEEFRKAMEE